MELLLIYMQSGMQIQLNPLFIMETELQVEVHHHKQLRIQRRIRVLQRHSIKMDLQSLIIHLKDGTQRQMVQEQAIKTRKALMYRISLRILEAAIV